jgi:hypothetical protein
MYHNSLRVLVCVTEVKERMGRSCVGNSWLEVCIAKSVNCLDFNVRTGTEETDTGYTIIVCKSSS